MDTVIPETLAEVTALIPRYSWEIMDEEQRDALMENVVLPRYMQTTADGVQLGPKAWAEMVGTTGDLIRGRVRRLQAAQQAETDPAPAAEPEWKKRDRRMTRQMLREATPEQIQDLIEEPDVRFKVSQALILAADTQPIGTARAPAPRRDYEPSRGPTTREMRRQRLLRLKQALIDAEASLSIASELLAATTPDFHEREELAQYVEKIATMIGDIVSRAEGDWDAALSKLLEE